MPSTNLTSNTATSNSRDVPNTNTHTDTHTDTDTAETPSDPKTRAVEALRAMNLAGQQFRQTLAHRFGIDQSAALTISHLAAAAPGSLSAHDIAERLGLTPSSVTSLVDRLEDAGLARRRPDRTDRRRTAITITAEGQRFVELARKWMHATLEGYDESELVQLASTLNGLADRVVAQTMRITTDGFG